MKHDDLGADASYCDGLAHVDPDDTEPLIIDPDRCPICGALTVREQRPYCSFICSIAAEQDSELDV